MDPKHLVLTPESKHINSILTMAQTQREMMTQKIALSLANFNNAFLFTTLHPSCQALIFQKLLFFQTSPK